MTNEEKNPSSNIRIKLNSETLLIFLFTGISIYMFYKSYDYVYEAGIFARLSAGVVIICGILLLMRNYLPEPLRLLVDDDAAVVDHEEVTKEIEEQLGDTSSTSNKENTAESLNKKSLMNKISLENGPLVTSSLTFAYLLAGYLVGLLWVTPVFIYFYGKWVGISRRNLWILIVISVIITYPFIGIMDLRLDSGIWTRGVI